VPEYGTSYIDTFFAKVTGFYVVCSIIRYNTDYSLYAHIIFWLHPYNMALVTNDIIAQVHTLYDDCAKDFIHPFKTLSGSYLI
jgi:hypothetical protein